MHGHPGLDVDHLLVLHYLTRHHDLTARVAAEIRQRPLESARESLGRLVAEVRLLEAGGGAGRGRYYRLSRAAYGLLMGALNYHVDQRLALGNAKARLLAVLRERSLSNSNVREITQFLRYQSVRLMASLRAEALVELKGARRGARWVLCGRTKE